LASSQQVTASHQERQQQGAVSDNQSHQRQPKPPAINSQPSTTRATSDKACTDYSSVPTKPQHHTRHESSCTAATEQSFSSLVWTVSTIHTAAHISTPVTGHYSDISQQYCVNPRIIGTGNYGSVRECVNLSTAQHYAVKSIDKFKIGRIDHL